MQKVQPYYNSILIVFQNETMIYCQIWLATVYKFVLSLTFAIFHIWVNQTPNAMEKEVLSFRVNPELKQRLRLKAKAKGETLSDYCRTLFYHAIRSKAPDLLTPNNQRNEYK